MSEELMAMIESLVQEHYGTQGLEYLRQRTRPAPAVQVPEGYVLVSRKLDNETWKRLIAADVWPVTPQSFQRMLDALAPTPATVATEAVALPKGCNSFGLDMAYFGSKMGRIMRDMSSYKPDEFARECARMAATADAAVLREAEFGAVAQGGGVDVEKVMALVQEFGEQCEATGYLDRSGSQDAAKRLHDAAYQTAVKIRALLASSPAGVGGWIPVGERLPEAGKGVLAYYKNSHGYGRIVRAFYAPKHALEANSYDDDGQFDYDEATDTAYLPEGWLEKIDNWGDFSSIYIVEGEVTHWQPLPTAPAIAKQSEGE